MNRASLVLLCAAALFSAACRPDYWCRRPGGTLPAAQAAALADLEAAGLRYRAALLDNEPEEGDAAHFAAMMEAGTRFLEARGPAPVEDAEKALAGICAAFVSESAPLFPSRAAREAAAERALRGFKRHVLTRRPDAARWLR